MDKQNTDSRDGVPFSFSCQQLDVSVVSWLQSVITPPDIIKSYTLNRISNEHQYNPSVNFKGAVIGLFVTGLHRKK